MAWKAALSASILACIIVAISPPARAKGTTKLNNPQDSVAFYNEVLDLVFSIKPPNDTYLLVSLRSDSSVRYECESQINIRQSDDGHLTVNQFYLPSGSESVWDQLQVLYTHNDPVLNQGVAEVANRIKVLVRNVNISEEVLRSFFAQLDNLRFPIINLKPLTDDKSISLTVDGSTYKLTYWTRQGEMHLNWTNPDLQDGNVKSIGDWMTRLENAINSAPSATQDSTMNSPILYRSGVIFGVVFDSKYERIPNASVTVTDTKTNHHWPTSQTDANGEFMLPDLQPGEYTVTVEADHPQIRSTQTVTVIPGRQAFFQTIAKGRVGH
jgi:hypothetical protein